VSNRVLLGWIVGLVVFVVVVGTVAVLLTRGGDVHARVDASALPLAKYGRVTAPYMNCSPDGDASYIPDRPCDTYFLLASSRRESADVLLRVEQTRLGAAGWRHSPSAPLGVWGAPHHEACGVVTTAAAGSRSQALEEADIVEPAGLTVFLRNAERATRAATLYVHLWPGEEFGRPAC
jgi:hypothetical protein